MIHTQQSHTQKRKKLQFKKHFFLNQNLSLNTSYLIKRDVRSRLQTCFLQYTSNELSYQHSPMNS